MSVKQIAAAVAGNALLEQQNSILEDLNHQQWWTSLSEQEKIARIERKYGPMYARHTPSVLARMTQKNRNRHLELRAVFENDPLNFEAAQMEALHRWALEDGQHRSSAASAAVLPTFGGKGFKIAIIVIASCFAAFIALGTIGGLIVAANSK